MINHCANPKIKALADEVYRIVQPYSGGTISYGDVCAHLPPRYQSSVLPNSDTLAAALGCIVDKCRQAGKAALSAVVIRADTGMPGEGYYAAAHPTVNDPAARQIAWAAELATANKEKYPPKLDDF